MASLRPGLKHPPGQGDITRTRRIQSIAPQGTGHGKPSPREPDNSRALAAPMSYLFASSTLPTSRSGPTSRIPQTSPGPLHISSSPRRPPEPQQKTHSRPPLTHQSQSWGLAMRTSGSDRSGPHAISPPEFAPRYPRSTSGNSAHASGALQRHGHSGKPSSMRSRNNSKETSSSSSATRSQTPLNFDRGLAESPTELRLARTAEVTSAHTVTIYPELDRYRDIHTSSSALDGYGPAHPDILFRLATESLPPPPTPHFSGTNSLVSGMSGSPSTRFSESPGPGPYSRDTTPTSVTSQSPGLVASAHMPAASRMRQTARGRTGSFGKDSPVGNGGIRTTTTTHTLAAIRESLNSSSSSSNGTVRGVDKREKIKKKRLSPLPPSPPPRKSSQKFKKSDDEQGAPGWQQTHSAQPSRSRPPPASPKASSLAAATLKGRHQAVTSPHPHRQATPPTRPSRDGTPDLQSQLDFPLPIIQSHLAYTALSDQRASLHTISPPPTINQQHLLYDQQRPDSPSFSQSSQPQAATQHHTRYPTGVAIPQSSNLMAAAAPPSTTLQKPQQANNSGKEPQRTMRTPSPNVSTFRTRFPLFGRRTKTAPAVPDSASTSETKEAAARKGPAAGTGHEGYGRLGSGRRRSSSVSTFLRGTGSSQESLASPQFRDPFLRDRLSPVVISGGEVIENQNTGYDLARTDSNTSASASTNAASEYRRPSTDSRAESQVSVSSREGRTTLWPSAIPRDSNQISPMGGQNRRPSESSDSEAVMKSTLAFRRSIQRLRSPDRAQVRVPKPIVVRPTRSRAPSSMNSMDTSILTDDSIPGVRREVNSGTKDSFSAESAPVTKKLTKRARSPRKWNLFGRSQSQPATTKKALQSTSTVAVTVETALPAEKSKPVAFYAMIDSSEQEDGDMDVEDILREARLLGSPTALRLEERERRPSIEQTRSEGNVPSGSRLDPQVSQVQVSLQSLATSKQKQHSHRRQSQQQARKLEPVTFPAKDVLSPQVQAIAEAARQKTDLPKTSATRPGRPSRLPQVGRIPKVVSARPEQTSPKSFSRPFNRASLQVPPTLYPLLNSPDEDSVAKGPSPPKSATPELMHDGSTVTGGSTDPTALLFRLSRNFTPDADVIDNSNEFFTLSPRKDSQTTSCTSSSGLFSFAEATAVIPDPSAPLVEDEIWDEYNDLLGEEAAKVPPSAGSSQGLPFHLETSANDVYVTAFPPMAKVKKAQQKTATALESPTITTISHPNRSIGETVLSGRLPVAPSVYPTSIDAQGIENEQRSSGLSQLPTTPFSVSEFVSGYGDRNNSGIQVTNQAFSQRSSVSSQRSGKRAARISDSSIYSQVSEDHSPVSQVNLRVGSMTVSKWLTFGHVLFSPARDDMVLAVSPPNGHSVLVIDGLGNDDWSFYAAETYPAATFFNLSPRAPLPVDHQNGVTAFPISPPNHHQVQYTSHADKLPFQPEIFTTVVYRFPAAAPESHYKNIINEARRVLQPGGYLELSILDLDLNNMGNRTRRAIRRLKEQVHAHAPDMHLGSTADAILRLLGTKGFTDIKSCRVGIPVASPISQIGDETNSGGETKRTRSEGKPKRDQRSLAEMINDESPVADESITNMVARVGRWWHSRCYGDAAMDPSLRLAHNTTGSNDMWMDRALLAECEEWRTNLKLMVCYARVPDIKRVASI